MATGHKFSAGHRKLGGRRQGGLNRVTREIRDLAQGYGPEALKIAVQIMRKKSATDQARLDAVAIVLDRAYGRPPQSTDLHLTGDLHIESLSDRQLSALIARLDGAEIPGGAGDEGDPRPLPN